MRRDDGPSDDEVAEELRSHIAMDTAARIARGEEPRAAGQGARRAFGNLLRVAELTRETRRGGWQPFAEIAQDARLALRRLRRDPGLALAIILTIGLGLGSASAILSITNAAFLAPLPYADAGRLVHVWESRAGTGDRSPTTHATLLDWRTQARSLVGAEAYDPGNFTISTGDDARMQRGAQVTTGFFGLLGVVPAGGRDLRPGDEQGEDGPVAVVSERFARSLSGADALGRTIEVNGTAHRIVGVLPERFHFALLQDAEVFVPWIARGDEDATTRTDGSLSVVARLREGSGVAAAQAELAGVMSRLASSHPRELTGRTVVVRALPAALIEGLRPTLLALLVAVALLFAMMVANLASLHLTRLVARRPELRLRASLGASRWRLARQSFVESLVPSLLGAVLAIGIGGVVTDALLRIVPHHVMIGMPYLADARAGWPDALVIIGLSMLFALGYGLVPGFAVAREPRGASRAGDARSTDGRRMRTARRVLAGAQLALTVVLLDATGFLSISMDRLVTRALGFEDPGTLVTARVPLTGPRFDDPAIQRQFYDRLLERASGIHGVERLAAIDEVPGGGGGTTTFDAVDRSDATTSEGRAAMRTVSGAYFETMGIPVLGGRTFDARDRDDAPATAVVSRSFARLLEPNGSAVGRRVRLARTDTTEWEVVGVVGDVQVAAMDLESPPVIYVSQGQWPENRMTIVARTARAPADIGAELGAIVRSLDAGVPTYDVATMAQRLRDSRALFTRRLPLILCGVFALAALALMLVTLHALCLHDVLSRRREFGIRIALGSAPSAIRRLLLRDGLRLAAGAVVVGSAIAVVAATGIEAVLYGVSASEWRVYVVTATGLLGVTLAVTIVPALRVRGDDLAESLRGDS